MSSILETNSSTLTIYNRLRYIQDFLYTALLINNLEFAEYLEDGIKKYQNSADALQKLLDNKDYIWFLPEINRDFNRVINFVYEIDNLDENKLECNIFDKIISETDPKIFVSEISKKFLVDCCVDITTNHNLFHNYYSYIYKLLTTIDERKLLDKENILDDPFYYRKHFNEIKFLLKEVILPLKYNNILNSLEMLNNQN